MTRVASKMTIPLTSASAQGRRRPLHLFVLIDALGWRYVEERQFLNDILPNRSPLRTVLGFSSGAIPTILTGVPPSQTGHWNLFYFDAQGSPYRWLKYFDFLPDSILNHRVTAKILKELGRHVFGLGPLFDCAVPVRLLRWFNYVERRNIYEPNGIVGAQSIFDQLGEQKIPHQVYTYHHHTDEEVLENTRRDLQNGESQFFFVYLSEMDMFLHTHCDNPALVSERLEWYERKIREIYFTASDLDPNVSLTIFSDHGMTPVKQHYDLMKDIDSLGFRTPQDYLVVYDSTMARFWFFSDAARLAVERVLSGSSCGRVIRDLELRELGVWFDDQRFGQLIFVLHPGWLLAKSHFNGTQWIPVGMHGYHPDDSYSDAICLSNRWSPSQYGSIADVYSMMRSAIAELCETNGQRQCAVENLSGKTTS